MLVASAEERLIVDPLLQRYDEFFAPLKRTHETLLRTIVDDDVLKPLIHSTRARIKDRAHLEDKLLRKMREDAANGIAFDVVPDNLHTAINDLAGIRILHLHSIQARDIHSRLDQLLRAECGYQFLEGPEARTWDIEYEAYFQKLGFATKVSKTLYTSVHYVIAVTLPKIMLTCELQVRT